MKTTLAARCTATGITSPLEAARLIWSGNAGSGDQAAWAALTHGLETLTAVQVQQRFASEGIEITLDAAAELQADAIIQGPSGVVPVVGLDDEHTVAAVNVGNGASLHGARPAVETRIVRPGITNISAREQALIDTLKAIIAETMAYPAKRPHSADSYLPEDFVLSGIRALGAYGIALPTYLERGAA